MGSKKAERTEPNNQLANDELNAAAQEQFAAAQEPAAKARKPGEDGPKREYPPETNPRPWAQNSLAGVQLRSHREPYEAELAFRDKPSQPVIDFLKESGFRWNNQEKIWTRPVAFTTQAQDRLVASRTYNKVVNMILEEKGLAPAPEAEVSF